MTTEKVIETNDTKLATKEEVNKLYQYFVKKNKNIYERLASSVGLCVKRSSRLNCMIHDNHI